MNALKKTQTKELKMYYSFVYLIGLKTLENSVYLKIGSSSDPEKRLKQLQTSSPFELILIGYFRVNSNSVLTIEKQLQERFAFDSINGEWFNQNFEIYDLFDVLCKRSMKYDLTDLFFDNEGNLDSFNYSEKTTSNFDWDMALHHFSLQKRERFEMLEVKDVNKKNAIIV